MVSKLMKMGICCFSDILQSLIVHSGEISQLHGHSLVRGEGFTMTIEKAQYEEVKGHALGPVDPSGYTCMMHNSCSSD